jgi:hypothetical protein
VQSLGGMGLRFDEAIERHRHDIGGTNLVGGRRGAQRHVLGGKAFALSDLPAKSTRLGGST